MSRYLLRTDGKTVDRETQDAEHADLTAKAKRVVSVDVSGNSINKTEGEREIKEVLEEILIEIKKTNKHLECMTEEKINEVDLK